MSDYTPTTDEVRRGYADTIDALGGAMLGVGQFTRWLAQERAQAKAEALRGLATHPKLNRRESSKVGALTQDRIRDLMLSEADYIERGAGIK